MKQGQNTESQLTFSMHFFIETPIEPLLKTSNKMCFNVGLLKYFKNTISFGNINFYCMSSYCYYVFDVVGPFIYGHI